jgi:hypothetical protein
MADAWEQMWRTLGSATAIGFVILVGVIIFKVLTPSNKRPSSQTPTRQLPPPRRDRRSDGDEPPTLTPVEDDEPPTLTPAD